MANIAVNIKPTAISQADLVDVLYMICSSIIGVCKKLDADGGVTLTTYVANCCTAKILTDIEDSKGNRLITIKDGSLATIITAPNKFISPIGLTDEALIELLYEIFDAGYTLLAQLDTDSLGDSNYVSSLYTTSFPWNVTNKKGSSLGNGGAGSYSMGPVGRPDDRNLVDLLYALVNVIYLTCSKLDADGTVSDTNYTALWYTANILLKIENSAGSTIGIAKPY
jgi:hypothetical protein